MRRSFTLIEILVVIGIILVLAGILLPAVQQGVKKSEIAKAKAEMTTLLNALKQYEATYHRYPTFGEDEYMLSSEKERYKAIIKVLQGDNSASDSASKKFTNSRNVKFLEEKDNDHGTYTDPWGNDYIICVRANYDGEITGSDNIPAGLNTTKVYGNVVIWSKGPDGESSASTKSDAKNKDNVYTFSTIWHKDNGHNIQK